MEFKDIKEKTTAELKDLLKKHQEHSRALRFSVASKQEKNIRNLRTAKKTVAKILTETKNRILELAKNNQAK